MLRLTSAILLIFAIHIIYHIYYTLYNIHYILYLIYYVLCIKYHILHIFYLFENLFSKLKILLTLEASTILGFLIPIPG